MRNRKDTVSTFRHLCPTLCATIRSFVVGDQQVGRFFFEWGFFFQLARALQQDRMYLYLSMLTGIT